MTINKIDYTVYKYIDNAYVDISHLIDYGFTASEKNRWNAWFINY